MNMLLHGLFAVLELAAAHRTEMTIKRFATVIKESVPGKEKVDLVEIYAKLACGELDQPAFTSQAREKIERIKGVAICSDPEVICLAVVAEFAASRLLNHLAAAGDVCATSKGSLMRIVEGDEALSFLYGGQITTATKAAHYSAYRDPHQYVAYCPLLSRTVFPHVFDLPGASINGSAW